jgi:TolB-like protein
VVWTFLPQRNVAPTGTATPTAAITSPATTVRIATPAMIGPHSTELGTAIAASLATSLVRAGYTVIGADSARAAIATVPNFVVQTTVQESGPRARANVRVLRGVGDAIVWSDQLDFRADDSFAAQDTIAARLGRALRTLTPSTP